MESFADCVTDGIDGASCGLSKEMFEFGKDLFDRVQVGGVFWQEEELGANATNELAYDLALVAAEIVEDHDIAGTKGWKQHLLDIGSEALAVDRSLDEPWRVDPVVAQGCQEGHGLPAAVRNLGGQSVPTRRPPAQGSHVGSGPGLVDEDQPLSLDAILIFCPLGSSPRDRGTVAFAGHHAFF